MFEYYKNNLDVDLESEVFCKNLACVISCSEVNVAPEQMAERRGALVLNISENIT